MNSCLFVVLRFHREDKVTDPCQSYEVRTMGDINGKIISRRRTPNSQKSTFSSIHIKLCLTHDFLLYVLYF